MRPGFNPLEFFIKAYLCVRLDAHSFLVELLRGKENAGILNRDW